MKRHYLIFSKWSILVLEILSKSCHFVTKILDRKPFRHPHFSVKSFHCEVIQSYSEVVLGGLLDLGVSKINKLQSKSVNHMRSNNYISLVLDDPIFSIHLLRVIGSQGRRGRLRSASMAANRVCKIKISFLKIRCADFHLSLHFPAL